MMLFRFPLSPFLWTIYLTPIFFTYCTAPEKPEAREMEVQADPLPAVSFPLIHSSPEHLYDKVLGMLVGSAIGDAMGAPTEMWSRFNIQVEYGHVDSLDAMVREPSPEGTWAFNLPAGGTTDDTRWKVLWANYFQTTGRGFYQEGGADPYIFAQYIVNQYEKEIQQLKDTESFDPIPFESQARRMAWLQEWALVAKPFVEKDLEGYSYAVNRFYGGEMTCAGMLYSPMLGLAYPGAPSLAYQTGYRLGLFDLGYARDISALTASLVAAAMAPDATQESVIQVLQEVDPNHYFHSRLVGRSSYRFYRDALYLTHEAKSLTSKDLNLSDIKLPFRNRDTLRVAQVQRAYELLDAKTQDMPFHAGEIHLINLAALLFSEFDFQEALEFVINYGRDNDTVGAITGAILGAFHGASQLPDHMVQTVLQTNKEKLGIDLEQVAQRLTDQLFSTGVVDTQLY